MNDEELAKQLQAEYDFEVMEEVFEIFDKSVTELDCVNTVEDMEDDEQKAVPLSEATNVNF